MDKFVFKQKIVEVLRFWRNPSRRGRCVRLFFSIVVFIVVVVVVVDTDTDVAAVVYVWGVRADVDGTAGQAHLWGESARGQTHGAHDRRRRNAVLQFWLWPSISTFFLL